MKKYYYKENETDKKTAKKRKKITRLGGIGLIFLGASILLFYSFPVLLWNLFFTSSFGSLISPVPPPFILTPEIIHAMEKEQTNRIIAASDPNAAETNNWVLAYKFKKSLKPSVSSYTITIPKLSIEDAIVSTTDFDLAKHLVQYWGTPIPPEHGNTVIFGHSTLPQLFQPRNYETIFADAFKLKPGDLISIKVNNRTFNYKVMKTFITEPDDTSVLDQDSEGSYFTIVTCTPPGTIWKRLIIKARLSGI